MDVCGILGNIAIGILTGLYSGLIVARWARFNAARSDLLLAIQNAGFRYDATLSWVICNPDGITDIYYAVAKMKALGHPAASSRVEPIGDELRNAMKAVLADAKSNNGQASGAAQAEFNARFTAAQQVVGSLRPDWLQLLVCGRV